MIKAVIIADDRKVTVQTDDGDDVTACVNQALRAWRRTRPARSAAPERPTIEAGGMGFQADLAPQDPDELGRH